MKKRGTVTIPSGCYPKPHELNSVYVFRDAGENVTFITLINKQGVKNADILLRGLVWEIKAPTSSKIDAVERSLKRAARQSNNIIFDARRMHNIPAYRIRRELDKRANLQKQIKHLILIDKYSKIIDIK